MTGSHTRYYSLPPSWSTEYLGGVFTRHSFDPGNLTERHHVNGDQYIKKTKIK